MLTRLSYALLLAAVGLAGWGVWQMLLAPAPQDSDPPLIVEWPAPNLGEMSIGTHEVTVRITNPSGRTRRIIGMMAGCRPNVCFGPKQVEPVAIPTGETVPYVCEVIVSGSGPFEFPLYLYLEDGGIREVVQTLRGVAVAPGGADARNPKSGL